MVEDETKTFAARQIAGYARRQALMDQVDFQGLAVKTIRSFADRSFDIQVTPEYLAERLKAAWDLADGGPDDEGNTEVAVVVSDYRGNQVVNLGSLEEFSGVTLGYFDGHKIDWATFNWDHPAPVWNPM